ncbi:MAG: NifU family protein [Halobacteriota archaeon]
MSAQSSSGQDLEDRVELFMMRNFPQIQMHGGSAGIEAIDEETGEIWISLTGACSGCGISPMTIQALKARMVAEFDEISEVHATTGMGGFETTPDDSDFSDVPF